ncbi:MAG: hypothetical protein ACTSSH_01645 [Candidatus Heimdallarchaeota archaeon]
MTEEKLTEKDFHIKWAKKCFNATWGLMDKENRTLEEDFEMIHTAHASRFHWGIIGEPIHFERGEWQISRVYSILKKPNEALYHAQQCLDICLANNIGDFDLAFAYEALARGNAIAGNDKEKTKYFELAKDAAKKIAKKEDKDYFMSELATIQ